METKNVNEEENYLKLLKIPAKCHLFQGKWKAQNLNEKLFYTRKMPFFFILFYFLYICCEQRK